MTGDYRKEVSLSLETEAGRLSAPFGRGGPMACSPLRTDC